MRVLALPSAVIALSLSIAIDASAFKFEETYGFATKPPMGYVQSAGAHTFAHA